MSERPATGGPEPAVRKLAISDLEAHSLDELFSAVGSALERIDARISGTVVARALAAREELGTTALGHGVAMPHARSNEVAQPVLLLARLEEPIDIGAADGVPVGLFAVIVTPAASPSVHLRILALVSGRLRLAGLVQRLLNAVDADQMLRELDLPPGVAA